MRSREDRGGIRHRTIQEVLAHHQVQNTMADAAPMHIGKGNLFHQLGGYTRILAVTTLFYDKVYNHPWLKLFFRTIPKEHIAKQQALFMQGVLGGPKLFCGHTPGTAHPHIRITDQAFDLRQKLLHDSLQELRIDTAIVDKWMALDEAFRDKLVKSPHECKKRYFTDSIIDPPIPPTH